MGILHADAGLLSLASGLLAGSTKAEGFGQCGVLGEGRFSISACSGDVIQTEVSLGTQQAGGSSMCWRGLAQVSG